MWGTFVFAFLSFRLSGILHPIIIIIIINIHILILGLAGRRLVVGGTVVGGTVVGGIWVVGGGLK